MSQVDLSIVLPTLNEESNVTELLRWLKNVLDTMGINYEIIVVDGGSKDHTVSAALNSGLPLCVIEQKNPGYAEALRLGFAAARGNNILTLDADLSHMPTLIPSLWQVRNDAEIIVASRYVKGGSAKMPLIRFILSRILNFFFTKGLSLPVRDISSGFRLYQASLIKKLNLTSINFEVLEEVLIKCFAGGWKIKEIPMTYLPRKEGKSKANLAKFAYYFAKEFIQMWRLRNSIESADYDDRAFDSRIPLQRYWQRKRYAIISHFSLKEGRILDIGCSSSRILPGLPSAIGLDISLPKLRYARKFGHPLVNASIWALPFDDGQFDCVVCSEVIEHIPFGEIPFLEIRRILKPGGRLIMGTPDYGHFSWRMIEKLYRFFAPGGYADEHITHYTLSSLRELLHKLGFSVDKIKYILNSEMILQCTLTPSKV